MEKLCRGVTPEDPSRPLRELEARVAQLADQLEQHGRSAEAQAKLAQAEAQRRAAAEEAARQAELERAQSEALATQLETERIQLERQFEARLQEFQLQAVAQPAQLDQVLEHSAAATAAIRLSEAETRLLIDEQFRQAGWEADSERLNYATGARPVAGQMRTIAEWPTASGPDDYVLFHGLTPLAVVEAKKKSKNVRGALAQSQRYSRDYRVRGEVFPRVFQIA